MEKQLLKNCGASLGVTKILLAACLVCACLVSVVHAEEIKVGYDVSGRYLVLASPAPVYVVPKKDITVGYDVSGSYLYQNQNGEFRGLDVEYLYEIAKYTGWHYKFVPFKNWGDAVQSLEEGKIDILPTVLKAPERESKLLFSTRRMGNVYVALVVGKNDKHSTYGEFSHLQGARIGVRRNTLDAVRFIAWAEEQNLQCTIVTYNGQKDLLAALDDGDIQAAALTYTGMARAYRALAEFSPQDMYFAVTPGKQHIYNQLNLAMGRIDIMNPEFFLRVTRKYMEGDTNPTPVFSLSEQQYIKEAPTIRVTLMENGAPFSYQDKGGKFLGILPDLYARLGELSGLKFTFVPVASQVAAMETVKNKQAEIIGRMAVNGFFADEKGLRLTTPFAKLTLVQLSRRDQDTIKTIAIQEPALEELIETSKAASKMELKKNGTAGEKGKYLLVPDFLESLADKQVDAIYCDSATANYFLRTHRASEYQMSFLRNNEYDLAIAICQSADPRLAPILDKCIRFLSVDEINGMITKNSVPLHHSMTEVLNQLPGQTILFVMAVLAIIALCMGYLSFQLWRQRGVEQRLTAARVKNEQMQAQMEAARKINEAKEDFFSHISHDMRTPLNGIIGFTDLAAQSKDMEGVKGYLHKIKISSRILLDLINDTLQLSKLERGKYPLVWEKVDSVAYMNSILTPLTVIAQNKGVILNLDTSKLEACLVMVDRLSTQKIFLNILGNAVKFTPTGGQVKMTVVSAPVTGGKIPVTVTISDTGIGIGKEFLPQVFELFAQEQRPEVQNQQGNGLGLAIVKKLVLALGGTINIESTLNVGTTITVVLPLTYAGPATGDTSPALDEARQKVEPLHLLLKGKKILLCEDNLLNTEIAAKLLISKGMVVEKATNGEEGVKKFTASSMGDFAAILMDLRMPVMDGYAATKAIRALPRPDAVTVPILALSADAYEEDVQRCEGAGMNGHVAKPIDPEKLFAELERVLQA